MSSIEAQTNSQTNSQANSQANSEITPTSSLETTQYRKLGTDPALVSLFCHEVQIQLDSLNSNLIRLETEGFQSEILAALMRSAHSLKGAARMVRIDLAVDLTHELETYFVSLQKSHSQPDAVGCDLIFQSLDALESIADRLHHFPNDPLDQEAPTVLNCARQIAQLNESNPEINRTNLAASTFISSYDNLGNSSNSNNSNISVDTNISNSIEASNISSNRSSQIDTDTNTNKTNNNHPISHSFNSNQSDDRNPANPSIRSTISPNEQADRTIRLSCDNLSRIMGLVGESLTETTWLEPFSRSLMDLKGQQTKLIELLDALQAELPATDAKLHTLLSHARNQANFCRRSLLDRTTKLEEYASRSQQLANRLYQEVIESQMRPFSDIGLGFPRMVRDLARQVNKQIKLEVVGKQTCLDRDILDHLEAPLTHLLRNAIDHGIESPDDRIRLGKPAYGTILLTAKHRAGNLVITVQDDGRGIHPDQLRDHILKRQLATPEMVAQLTQPELMAFLYLPGFSTADRVTELSGRGVGLDVVHTLVQNVGGTLTTQSQPGKGTTFSLHLPLTRSLLRTLVVEIAGHPYGFPITRIDRVSTLSSSEVYFSENHPYFLHGQRAIGLIRASEILQLKDISSHQDKLTILHLSDGQSHYGLVVDRILGEEKLVVKPMHPRLGKVPNLSSAALRSDGTIAFIIDNEDFLQSIQKHITQPSPWIPSIAPVTQTRQKRILVVDDSITVRETQRKLLENQGYHVEVAINGMDGWNALQFGQYDLLITDIDMPRMNGIELVAQTKAHPKFAKLPTIIISYKDREQDRLRGLEVGADYYLTKSSFHDDKFSQAVVDLIGDPACCEAIFPR